MATYQSVQRQIAELQKKAEVLRKAEAEKVITGIKAQIAKYSLTPSDLFEGRVLDISATTVSAQKPTAQPAVKASAKKSDRRAPKYMDPVTKKTWSGRGKAPAWIKEGKREDYLIGTEQPAAAPKAKAAAKKSGAPVKAAVQSAAKALAAAASKKQAAAVKAKSAPLAKPRTASVAKPAAIVKAKPAQATKPVAGVKAKAVTTPAPKALAAVKRKAAPAKKATSVKSAAVSPQKPVPADQVTGVEVPVTAPEPVAVTPATGAGAIG